MGDQNWLSDTTHPHPLKGFFMESYDATEMKTQVEAYRDVEDGAPPLLWTPAHVQTRLVEAFRVVIRTAGHIGPVGYKTAWPGGLFREWADLVDPEVKERLQRYNDEREKNGWSREPIDWEGQVDSGTKRLLQDDSAERLKRNKDEQFTPTQIHLADEAMVWAARFLADSPMQSDALQFWALGKAKGVGEKGFAKLLRVRALIADTLVDRRKCDIPDKLIIYEEESEAAARKVAAWANETMAAESDKAKHDAIRFEARARFDSEIRVTRAVEHQTFVRRRDVLPDRVFSVSAMDRQRKKGSKLLAKRLQNAGVRVR